MWALVEMHLSWVDGQFTEFLYALTLLVVATICLKVAVDIQPRSHRTVSMAQLGLVASELAFIVLAGIVLLIVVIAGSIYLAVNQ